LSNGFNDIHNMYCSSSKKKLQSHHHSHGRNHFYNLYLKRSQTVTASEEWFNKLKCDWKRNRKPYNLGKMMKIEKRNRWWRWTRSEEGKTNTKMKSMMKMNQIDGGRRRRRWTVCVDRVSLFRFFLEIGIWWWRFPYAQCIRITLMHNNSHNIYLMQI
jgi:hypothetical protein